VLEHATPPAGRVLVVDDDQAIVAALCHTLGGNHYQTKGVTSAEEALDALRASSFDVLLTDLSLPEMDGVALLRAALELDPHLAGIIMTGRATVQTAVDAMKVGAHDFLVKPLKLGALLPAIARGIGVRRLREENTRLRARLSIYEAVFQGTPAPTWVIDRTGQRFLAVNDAAVQRYGWSREDLATVTPFDLIPPDDHDRLRVLVSGHVVATSAGDPPWRHRRKDGTTADVLVEWQAVDLGDDRCWIVTVLEVSERLPEDVRPPALSGRF
jgi:PAS domain S-box-containing protein